MRQTNNLRIEQFKDIESPESLRTRLPLTEKAAQTVFEGRKEVEAILRGEDQRKLIVVGPCSIHDRKAALEYAERLAELREKVADKYVIVMRAYFEKPRTTVGWKGFVYDPFLDGSYNLEKGVELARELLIEINELGLPTATEVLGPVVIQYYSDLITWSAIGARTTESQTHRELASGLSMPVGFKNGTSGDFKIAINAILSAAESHHFLGMDENGKVAVVETKGNNDGHVILRGGSKGPNYDEESVAAVASACKESGVCERLIVDCSHANSDKDFRKQGEVFEKVIGNEAVVGVMIESNINEGQQGIDGALEYGMSVTDGCIGWEETVKLLT